MIGFNSCFLSLLFTLWVIVEAFLIGSGSLAWPIILILIVGLPSIMTYVILNKNMLLNQK